MHIPAGTTVILNTWGLHHSPSQDPSPSIFEPTRYASSPLLAPDYAASPDYASRDHYGYGAGRRICPGIHLAERNLWLGMAKLLWAFELKEDESRPVDADPKTGYSEGFLTCAKDFGAEVRVRGEGRRTTIFREFEVAERDVFSGYEADWGGGVGCWRGPANGFVICVCNSSWIKSNRNAQGDVSCLCSLQIGERSSPKPGRFLTVSTWIIHKAVTQKVSFVNYISHNWGTNEKHLHPLKDSWGNACFEMKYGSRACMERKSGDPYWHCSTTWRLSIVEGWRNCSFWHPTFVWYRILFTSRLSLAVFMDLSMSFVFFISVGSLRLWPGWRLSRFSGPDMEINEQFMLPSNSPNTSPSPEVEGPAAAIEAGRWYKWLALVNSRAAEQA